MCNSIKLRRIIDDDLTEMFENRNDEKIMNWCRQYAPLHLDDHYAWFTKQRVDPEIEMFVAYNTDRQSMSHLCPVGVVGLTSIDRNNSNAEFSCYIYKEYQRCGYATKALKKLLQLDPK